VFPRNTEAARRIERGSRIGQGLVVEKTMKAKFMRIALTLSSVAMIAIAGGASLRGF
jgi:hypothetical protein